MKIEKKLIALCTIAVTIGVASIVPIFYLMSAKTAPSKPWFNIAIPYAYLTAVPPKNPTGLSPDSIGIWDALVINSTINGDAWDNNLEVARLEFFQIRIYHDNGFLYNTTFFVLTNRTSSSEPFPSSIENLIALLGNTTGISGTYFNYFNHTEFSWGRYSRGLGSFSGNLDQNRPELMLMKQKVLEFKNAEKVYIDVSRLSSTTFKMNSTITESSSNAVLQHIELKRFGDGFLYNSLVPEEQLSHINLLGPPKEFFD
jgi:hypothetical protein